MARTVRTYWNAEGRLITDHRDGKPDGLVRHARMSGRLSGSERQAAKLEARKEIPKRA